MIDTRNGQSGNRYVKTVGAATGLAGSGEDGRGSEKTMLRFIAEELTDSSGAAPPPRYTPVYLRTSWKWTTVLPATWRDLRRV